MLQIQRCDQRKVPLTELPEGFLLGTPVTERRTGRMDMRPRTWLTSLGVFTSHPIAFVLVALFVAAWLVFAPEDLAWHQVATVLTLFMTLVIQRAEHRDTQAIHAKLDELLKADGKARNELTEIDRRDAEEIERHRTRNRPRR